MEEWPQQLRIGPTLLAAIERLDDDHTANRGVYRRVAALASHFGLSRPSYGRSAFSSTSTGEAVSHRPAGQILLDVALRTRPPHALLELLEGASNRLLLGVGRLGRRRAESRSRPSRQTPSPSSQYSRRTPALERLLVAADRALVVRRGVDREPAVAAIVDQMAHHRPDRVRAEAAVVVGRAREGRSTPSGTPRRPPRSTGSSLRPRRRERSRRRRRRRPRRAPCRVRARR